MASAAAQLVLSFVEGLVLSFVEGSTSASEGKANDPPIDIPLKL